MKGARYHRCPLTLHHQNNIQLKLFGELAQIGQLRTVPITMMFLAHGWHAAALAAGVFFRQKKRSRMFPITHFSRGLRRSCRRRFFPAQKGVPRCYNYKLGLSLPTPPDKENCLFIVFSFLSLCSRTYMTLFTDLKSQQSIRGSRER